MNDINIYSISTYAEIDDKYLWDIISIFYIKREKRYNFIIKIN